MPDIGPILLTPEGFKRLQERLAQLKQQLPAIIEETQRTAAYGDRSDNAEYKQAKGALRYTNSQIFLIEDQLKRIQLIDGDKNTTGTVQVGNTVVVELNSMTRKTFRILGARETDPGKGRISNQSPLGAALLNHAKGDVITIETPGGKQHYTIIEIK